MLDKLRSFLAPKAAQTAPTDPARLAIAALLVEAAQADERYEARETTIIDAALSAEFGLDAAAASALRAEAEQAQADAADLHRFTRVAKNLPPEAKIRLLQTMWMIILSDNRRDPHEDALIRRLCGLIYVSDVESGAARRRAAEALRGPSIEGS
ncbi:MAG: TerB family tellurite resistance protein [Amphiplicatus sp.]